MTEQERLRAALEALGLGQQEEKVLHSKRRVLKVPEKMEDEEWSRKSIYFSCRKKKRYPSQHEAKVAASCCRNRRGVKLRVYPCEICGGWHLTKHVWNGRSRKT